MRIRKKSSPFPSSSPLRPQTQHRFPAAKAEADDSGELRCQINLSPWDAIKNPHCTKSQKELESTYAREEEDTMAGIVDSVFDAEEDEGVEEERKEQKKKGIETEGNKLAVAKCKKTDGKGWHCKRDAHLPHSLCGYHLAQLRSYRARVEEKVTVGEERCHRRKQPAAPMEAGGAAASNYYYYYSILGPWWGKRRAPADGKEKAGSDAEHNDRTNPGALADNDEEDDDGSCCSGDDDDDGRYKKKKPHRKKRGRKPVKARSLKSLL